MVKKIDLSKIIYMRQRHSTRYRVYIWFDGRDLSCFRKSATQYLEGMIIVTSRLIKIICRDRSRIKYFWIPFNSLLFNILGRLLEILRILEIIKNWTKSLNQRTLPRIHLTYSLNCRDKRHPISYRIIYSCGLVTEYLGFWKLFFCYIFTDRSQNKTTNAKLFKKCAESWFKSYSIMEFPYVLFFGIWQYIKLLNNPIWISLKKKSFK